MSSVIERKSTSMAERLESSIDRKSAGEIEISAKSGMVVENMAQVMEFSKLMSLAREAVPKHLRENAGACLAIAIQAYEWQISPFALANKSYVVNDRLCYEASLYHAVVERRAPIKGRIKHELIGDGANRTCRVWAVLAEDGSIADYESPKFSTINPKNSPLWKNDPDQQLFYFSVRGFARRNFPDVMMGIYTADEIQDSTEFARPVDSRPKAARLAEQLLSPAPAAVEPESFFAPQNTDDRRQVEPKAEPKAEPVEATPDIAQAIYDEINLAESIDDLQAAARSAAMAKEQGDIDQLQYDDMMSKIAKKRK